MKHYLVKHKLNEHSFDTNMVIYDSLTFKKDLDKKIKKAYHDLGIRIRSQFSAYKSINLIYFHGKNDGMCVMEPDMLTLNFIRKKVSISQ